MGWADGVGAGVSVENGLGHQEFAGGCFARARRTMNNPASRAGGGFSRPERLKDFAGEGYPMLGVVFELGESCVVLGEGEKLFEGFGRGGALFDGGMS